MNSKKIGADVLQYTCPKDENKTTVNEDALNNILYKVIQVINVLLVLFIAYVIFGYLSYKSRGYFALGGEVILAGAIAGVYAKFFES